MNTLIMFIISLHHTRYLFFEDPDQVVIDIKYFGTFFFRSKDSGSDKLFHILAHGGARSFSEHNPNNFWPAIGL